MNTINDLLNNFEEHITSKVKASYLYPTDEYGVSVNSMHYDIIRGIDVKDLNKNGINFLLAEHDTGKKNSSVRVRVTSENFGKYFDKSYTWNALVADLITLRKNCIAAQVNDNVQTSTASLEYATYRDTGYQFRTKDIQLFKNSVFSGKYNAADDDLLFDHLYKDYCNNIYMELNGKLYLVPFKTNSSYEIANVKDPDMQIWPEFFAVNDEKFKNWITVIMQCVEEYDANKDDIALEDAILALNVPRLFLSMCMLSIVQKGVTVKTEHGTKTEWYYVSTNVHLSKNGRAVPWTMSNKIDIFSAELLKAVDFSRVKTIPIFSNDPNEIAIKHLPTYTAFDSDTEPTLPEYWNRFLGGDRFFNPVMDKYKIASFINNSLNAKYSGRQVLVLGGKGEDGKGVFLDILGDIIGEEYVASLNVNAFTTEDRFGLAAIQNKKVVYLSDCKKVSTLFGSDKFKALTGGDKLTLERKYVDSVQYKATGVCVAVATNSPFYINGIHGMSRTVPVVFRKNFTKDTMLDKSELEQHLIAEKTEFLQWCADYAAYIIKKYPAAKKTYCADVDLNDIDKYDTEELFKRMCDTELLDGDRLCNYNNRSADEEADREEFNDIFREWLIEQRLCTNEYFTLTEVVEAVNVALVDNNRLKMIFARNSVKVSRSDTDYAHIREFFEDDSNKDFTFSAHGRINGVQKRSVIHYVNYQPVSVTNRCEFVSPNSKDKVDILAPCSVEVKNKVFKKMREVHGTTDFDTVTADELRKFIAECNTEGADDTKDDFYSHLITHPRQNCTNIIV